jgi:signal transduction histidine kinase
MSDAQWATVAATRLREDLRAPRIVVVAALCVILSLEILFQPGLLTLWSVAEVVAAWLAELLDLLAAAAVFMITLSLSRTARYPGAASLLAIAAASVAVAAAIAWRQAGGEAVDWRPIPGEALRWALLASLLAVADALYRRARRARDDARAIDLARQRQEAQGATAQVQLLQAQIEPHFLFNTLANLRRLGRAAPAEGVAMIDHLLRYLQAALPQMRRSDATLGDELALVTAYLRLLQPRMGDRLRFAVDIPADLQGLAFPPTTLLTLVENAIRHGLDPLPNGGRVTVTAGIAADSLQIDVTDDGVGLGASMASGTGVGLVNVQRQLRASFGRAAALELLAAAPHGTTARIVVPLSALQRPQQQVAVAGGTG